VHEIRLKTDRRTQLVDITQKLEQGGEAAHSEVVKAQIQLIQREQDHAGIDVGSPLLLEKLCHLGDRSLPVTAPPHQGRGVVQTMSLGRAQIEYQNLLR